MKKKKRYLISISTDKKSSQQRKTARLQNSDEKQDCQFWILRLVIFTRFPANKDCLLKLYMLVKSASTLSRKLHWGKRVCIMLTSWLTEGVVIILCFCAKLVFMLFIIGLS